MINHYIKVFDNQSKKFRKWRVYINGDKQIEFWDDAKNFWENVNLKNEKL